MKIKKSIFFVVAFGVVVACAYSLLKSFKPTIGVCETAIKSPVSGLPRTATNIRYFLRGSAGPCTAYDFDTTEADFEQWVVNMQDTKLVRSGSGMPIEVICIDATNTFVGPRREIIDGVMYSWSKLDTGTTAAYDRRNHRAYYYHSFR